jgi:hypothetical protein
MRSGVHRYGSDVAGKMGSPVVVVQVVRLCLTVEAGFWYRAILKWLVHGSLCWPSVRARRVDQTR